MVRHFAATRIAIFAVCAVLAAPCGNVCAQGPIQITVHPARLRQVFDGLGAGAIFYEGHITSLAARNKSEQQQQLVNAQDKDAPIALKLTGKFATATTAARSRTSAKEDAVALPALAGAGGTFADTLPARSMVTYRVDASSK